MPSNYENPDFKPCAGGVNWSPDIPLTIGDVNPLRGFSLMEINKGAFRNYYFNSESDSNIGITTGVKCATKYEKFYPIRNCTRPLQLSQALDLSGLDTPFMISPFAGNNFLINFVFKSFGDRRLSSVDLVYDLSINISGNILSELKKQPVFDSVEGRVVLEELSSGNYSGFILFLNQKKIKFIDFYDSDGNPIQFDGVTAGISMTRFELNQNSGFPDLETLKEKLVFVNIKFIDSNQNFNNRDSYKKYSSIQLRVNKEIKQWLNETSDLIFTLQKIRFYTADRVNLNFSSETPQLPANAIGYSMSINLTLFPTGVYTQQIGTLGSLGGVTATTNFSGVFLTPPTDTPNIHIKFFNPEKTSNSEGFAHSLGLRLVVISFPFLGPLGNFLLPGVTLPHVAIVIGPAAFNTQLSYTGTSVITGENKSAVVGQGKNAQVGTLRLKSNGQYIDNESITVISLAELLNKKNEKYIPSEYSELPIIAKETDELVNEYKTLGGRIIISNKYSAQPQRLTSFLNAYDNLTKRTEEKIVTYQSFISLDEKNTILKLFEFSPIVTYRLNNTQDVSNAIFSKSGVLSVSGIFKVDDESNLFDTKLVFRFYFKNKNNSNIKPLNSDFHLKIENNSGKSELTASILDNSWTYDNVLISGILDSEFEQIVTEAIINAQSSKVVFNDFTRYDLLCAIYAFSTLNEKNWAKNKTALKIDSLTSLSLPLVSLKISNNIFFSLPLFYNKSYNNGGNIQAQRDTTSGSDEYVLDTSIYDLSSLYFSGNSFDNQITYNGLIESGTNTSQVLTFRTRPTQTLDKLSVDLNEGILNYPSIKQIDFFINTKEFPSGAKITTNSDESFKLLINVTNEIKNVKVKFVIDLLDRNFNSIQKVIVSELQDLIKGPNDIVIPFNKISYYLSTTGSFLAISLIIYNSGQTKKIDFGTITLEKNSFNFYKSGVSAPTKPPKGFYEDLPLTPARAFGSGCDLFFFKIDYSSLNNTGSFIYDPLKGIKVFGAIYSPTWVNNKTYPENMEVQLKSFMTFTDLKNATTGSIRDGLSPYQVFFRTGNFGFNSLDTDRDSKSNMIVTTGTESTENSDTAVFLIQSEGYNRFFLSKKRLRSYFSNEKLNDLNLTNPSLSYSSTFLIQGGIDESRTPLEIDDLLSGIAKQPSSPSTAYPVDSPNNRKINLKNIFASDFDTYDSNMYSVGVTGEGFLIFDENSLESSEKEAANIVIEGPVKNGISTSLTFGKVSLKFPSIFAADSGDVVVFYSYASGNNSQNQQIKSLTSIYAKIINGKKITAPILVLDFQDFMETNSGFSDLVIQIGQITVCKDAVFPGGIEFYMTFDCYNKIFFCKLKYSQNTIRCLSLAIVYGNLIESNSEFENKFIEAVNECSKKGFIKRFDFLPGQETSEFGVEISYFYEKNLQFSQRVGLVDFDGFYMGVQFTEDLIIREVLFDKNYLLPATLRSIGRKLG
jgi:hypothetical protein